MHPMMVGVDDVVAVALIYAVPPTLAVLINGRKAKHDRDVKHEETTKSLTEVKTIVNGEREALLRRVERLEAEQRRRHH